MADGRPPRGVIDTSVVIDLPVIDSARLPVEVAISAITLAELAAGPHATSDSAERAKRQDRLQGFACRSPGTGRADASQLTSPQ